MNKIPPKYQQFWDKWNAALDKGEFPCESYLDLCGAKALNTRGNIRKLTPEVLRKYRVNVE